MYQCAIGKRSTSTMSTPLKSQCLKKLSSQDGGAHEQDCGEYPSKNITNPNIHTLLLNYPTGQESLNSLYNVP